VDTDKELDLWHGITTYSQLEGWMVELSTNDVRIRSHIVETHNEQEVCRLKWSGSGSKLANGENDNLLYI